jgi:hypothetical protein
MHFRSLPAALAAALAVAGAGTGASADDVKAPVAAATYAEPTSAADKLGQRSLPPTPQADVENVDLVRQLARQRGGQPEALAQIIQLSREFDDTVAAELVDELAAAHARAGDLNLAAETRRALAEQFPDQPIAREAILWLVRLYASSEVAHSRRTVSQAAVDLQRQLSAAQDASTGGSVQPAAISADGPASPAGTDPTDPLATYALRLAAHAMATNSVLADSPALAFQRSVAARRAGQPKMTQALLSPLKHRRAGDPWGDAARMEAWLQDQARDTAPRPIVACTSADAPPRLDGVLSDACWQARQDDSADQMTVRSEQPAPFEVRWRHDDEFLYVAIRCTKLDDCSYPRDDRPRPHDGDVEPYDRVRLLVDVDRDYASWFELVVDSRGWTADRCWHDAAWNPQWFVAAAESAADNAWIVEAAIPLAELTSQPPTSPTAWACAVERRPPGTPYSETSVESFSVLLLD